MKLIFNSKNRNISGTRVREARHNNKMTQKELSANLKLCSVSIDRSSISKIEQQKRIITDYEIVALSTVLKVRVTWLLGLDD